MPFFPSAKKPMHLFHLGGSSKKLISFLAQLIEPLENIKAVEMCVFKEINVSNPLLN
jgi:hypothetical protein